MDTAREIERENKRKRKSDRERMKGCVCACCVNQSSKQTHKLSDTETKRGWCEEVKI